MADRRRTACLITLGCKVNQQDSAAMSQALRQRGWEVVAQPGDVPESPSVILINSCAVTARAAAKSRQTARSYARRFPASRVVLCGCYPQTERQAAGEVHGVAMIAGTGRLATLEALEGLGLADRDAEAHPASREAPGGRDPLQVIGPLDRFEVMPPAIAEGRVRAYLKVQEGCEAGCAYCVVPLARGPQRSLPLDLALAQARELVSQGARELVITGIRLGAYGSDLADGSSLAGLIAGCAQLGGLARLRVSSIEPGDVSPAILEAMAAHSEVVCPHLHLPLQSGSDRILGLMGRDYDAAGYLAVVRAARAAMPDLAVGADVLVGFPGETEADLEGTIEVVRRAGLMRLHVFPYSVRTGTPAAQLPGLLPRAARESRAQRLTQIGRELALAHHKRYLDRTVDILLETDPQPHGPDGSSGEPTAIGLTRDYVRVHAEVRCDAVFEAGDIGAVRVTSVTAAGMRGTIGAQPPLSRS